MNMKQKTLTIRISEELINDCRRYCRMNGYDVSKRIRLFISNELKLIND